MSQPPAFDDRYRIISELTSDYAFAFRVEADGRAEADWLNEAFTRVTGFTVENLRSKGWLAMVHPEDRPAARRHARRLLTGAPDVSEHRIVTTTGEVRWLHSSALPVLDRTTGRITRIYGAAQDITERKRADAERAALLARERQARAEAETAQGRFAFLAEASSLLSSSLDYETTLANLAELAVTSLADWCAIYLVEADGVRLKTVAPADPAHREWARYLPARYPVPSAGVLRVLGTGRSELLMEIDPERIGALATDPQHRAVLRGLRSSLCVPLVTRGRTLGALVFASSEPTRHYDASRRDARRGPRAPRRPGRRQRPPLPRGAGGRPAEGPLPRSPRPRAPKPARGHLGRRAGAEAPPRRRRAGEAGRRRSSSGRRRTWRAWSTTSSTCRASRPARSRSRVGSST